MQEIFQFINYSGQGELDKLKQLYENYELEKREYLINQSSTIALSSACQFGHLEVIRWIREKNPQIDVLDNGMYNFAIACLNGRLEIIKQLHEWVPTLDVSNNDDEAFMWACFNGHLDIIKQLLEWKPTLNIYSRNKQSIEILCNGGHINILTYLIEKFGPLNFSGISLEYVKNRDIKQLIMGTNLNTSWMNTLIDSNALDEIECPICKTNLEKYVITPCGHKYCYSCINSWLSIQCSCPYCRRNIM